MPLARSPGVPNLLAHPSLSPGTGFLAFLLGSSPRLGVCPSIVPVGQDGPGSVVSGRNPTVHSGADSPSVSPVLTSLAALLFQWVPGEAAAIEWPDKVCPGRLPPCHSPPCPPDEGRGWHQSVQHRLVGKATPLTRWAPGPGPPPPVWNAWN